MSYTPVQFRIAGYVLTGIVVIAVFMLWLNSRDTKRELQGAAEQGVRTDQAASGIAQDAGVAATDRRQNEGAVTSARGTYQRGYEDARKNDPTVQPWGSRPIPQRLLDLARERRLARERSGCHGAGCPSDDGAERQ